MTTKTFIEAKIRNHHRDAALYDEFAERADTEGKFCMASAYRVIATTHRHCAEDLLRNLAADPPVA